ncbi:TetR/AcrR family transcriptional regulator [Dietzia sp. SLG310A2-38A2]|uniref:TetR/AcrR family transcriptional regulator n=1 Tax=Dietzia sp. SLG310A2-38A2 TaxID=1630643 RepID=UPI0015F7B395|nr:TetR/AcrR family transcriptional regulator [Dietzia sp. SLG310A2-38A2]MBB1030378.1 TetR/AcrR family transcriptional regulator [Dietzia sp. SLG310A2-38A2]
MAVRAEADQLLDAAEELFYERGYHSVGMDALRTASGLPLKRIYSLFTGKDAIAVAMLDRRDERWHESLAERVDQEAQPENRVLAIFDWLSSWLAGEGHRGCAWINAFGELGGTSPEVADAVRRHKTRFRTYVNALATEAGAPPPVADGIFLLVEGCMVTAGISGNSDSAAQANDAAARLLRG